MSEHPAVVIAGHGQMGHAMEALLKRRAHLRVWDIAPDRLEPPVEVLRDAARAELLLVCVPTVAHEAVLGPLTRTLPPACGILSIAKGLDDAGLCAAEILEQHLGARPWGVLGGPTIANELIAGKPGFAELGTGDPALVARARRLFPDRLGLEPNPDPRQVSWCGVLKNVYAPLIGISDGLGWGDNARGHLVMAAAREMQVLTQQFTGRPADVYGDAGLADFVTTVTSPSSHHYALGRRLAVGDASNLECEGVHSLRVLHAQGRLPMHTCPLLSIAARIVIDPHAVAPQLQGWLTAAG